MWNLAWEVEFYGIICYNKSTDQGEKSVSDQVGFLNLLQNGTPKQKKNLKKIAQLIDRLEEKHITMFQNLNDILITRRRGRFLSLMRIIVQL